MKLIIRNTTKMVLINGQPCRVWEGETESGIAVFCFIRLVAVASSADQAEFESELQEVSAPSAGAEAFPIRMLIS